MKIHALWFTIVGSVVMFSLPARSADLTLVMDGKPNAAIIVAAGETNAVKAAGEIQKYIEKMSGAKLPMVNEPDADNTGLPVKIAVGHTAMAKSLGVTVPSGFNPAVRPDAFEEEGYVVKAKGNTLVIGGNSDGPYQGTLYAAYALLEKLGCRWYFPGDWGEVVPKQKAVSLPEMEMAARPDFAIRGMWLSCWNPPEDARAYAEWCLKVGLSVSRDLYPVAGDGFLAGLLPASEYAEAHPEYYAMDKSGKRTVTPKSPQHATMLCLSNPDVLAASIESLKAAFAGQKKSGIVTANGVGISPPDGMPFCYCDKCLASSQSFLYPGYFPERMMSEEYCRFAAGLARAFPDKYVSLSAYSLREIPPQGLVLPPNVAVSIWPISSCVLHAGNDPACWRRQETMKIAQSWRDLTPHVVMCGYTPGMLSVYGPSGSYVPERDISLFAAEAPLLKKMGIKGSWNQGAPSFMSTWLSSYVRAKLLWNTAVDVPALKQEFYATFFGPEAGPHVQAWWDMCEEALAKSTCHAHEDWLVNHVYTVEFTQKLHEHVNAALKVKSTPERLGRIQTFAMIADHLEAYAAMHKAESSLDYVKAAAAADRMLADRQKLVAKDSFFVIGRPAKGGGKELPPDGNAAELRKVGSKAAGTNGALVVALPVDMKFMRDRFNEGVLAEWYAPTFDDAAWGTKNTFYTWDQQDPPEDATGHDYDGYGWYRATINIPKNAADKPLRIYLGGVINEGWVWINGNYAGHREHKLWWAGRDALEMDVDATGKVKAGPNTIAIRVWNDAEIGGLYRRGFLYTPVK